MLRCPELFVIIPFRLSVYIHGSNDPDAGFAGTELYISVIEAYILKRVSDHLSVKQQEAIGDIIDPAVNREEGNK